MGNNCKLIFKMRKIIYFSIVGLLLFSCTHKEDVPDSQELTGNWKVIGTSGGFAGSGYDINFDRMTIDSDLEYILFDGDEKLSQGEIEEKVKTDVEYLIAFKEKNSYTQDYIDLVSDPEKYVHFKGDTLHLNAPCCDRFNTHFLKE